MGAAILLDQAHDGTSPFDRLVLSAPMIGIKLRYQKAARRLTWLVDRLGFGTRLIPRGSEESIFTRQFENNILTSDDRQFDRLATAMSTLPDLAVGAPTIRWLSGAFRLVDRFADPRFAVETQTPILIVAAGADRIIDTAATERFAIRLKAGRCITIPDARHQLIMERDDIVRQFWAAFDAFIPGFEAETAPEPFSRRLPKATAFQAASAGPA
jgi:lysophospholipase